jgi:uncharacterized protein YbbK (DUF523 family)
MTDKKYLENLRIPTKKNPLRVLTSACLLGELCGVDGTSNGEYPSALKLMHYQNVKLISFCPEHFVLGTPRETPDCIGGNGYNVLDGKAKVITQSAKDITSEMVRASLKMLQIAQENDVELAVMMDVSGACGSQVIYNGSRFSENPMYQIGMGVCAAQLDRNGIKIISQRDLASLEILYSKIDPNHHIDKTKLDHHEIEWYKAYFNK